ncbi:OmpA family protein [Rubellimicrobium sp. CFH 75288]|uniref:OmpA family protein n=1 Tax=Rubellimicrobium sp. CFH 75288 TaxID=2697034 RepID=UPI00144B9410|nr:OmpA family protein [Rubellimicrobium sp. CFH 75288]NAZ35585.1 OmpA family protein [Rubellimicrobium sp. CFH 75288]
MFHHSFRATTALVATLALVLPQGALVPAARAQETILLCLDLTEPPCPEGEPAEGTPHLLGEDGSIVPLEEPQAEAAGEAEAQAEAEAEAAAQAEAEAAAQAEAERIAAEEAAEAERLAAEEAERLAAEQAAAEEAARLEAEAAAQAEAEAAAQAEAERIAAEEAAEAERLAAEEAERLAAEQAAAEEAAAEEAAAEEAAAEEAAAEEAAAEEAAAEEAAAEEAAAEEAAAEEAAAEEAAAEEAAAEEAARLEAEAAAQAEAEAAAQAEAERIAAEEAAEAERLAAEEAERLAAEQAAVEEAARLEAEAAAQAEAEAAARAEAEAAAQAAQAEEPAAATDPVEPGAVPEIAPDLPDPAEAGEPAAATAADEPAEAVAEPFPEVAADALAETAPETAAETAPETAPDAVSEPAQPAGPAEPAAPAAAGDAALVDPTVLEPTAPVAAATAAETGEEAPAEAVAEVETVTLTEEDVRSAEEDFDTTVTGQARAEGQPSRERGLSNLERALLLGLGAVAVGAVLNNGQQIVANTGDRVVTRDPQGGLQIFRDDDAILRQPGSTVRTETYPDGSTRTILERPDGTQVVTIRDATGRVLRRARVLPDGTQVELFDDLGAPVVPVDVRTLVEQAPPPVSASASEIDEALLRQLLLGAEPAVDPGRTFTLRQIREIEAVRNLVPAVDLDNITFATGSAAIPGAQLSNLVRMGRLIEEALERNPREVFLVEGHTDAVGSEEYNLALSDRRAESVALALTQNFNIPPENLVVQGFGEAFLKIPTQEAEERNRRATLRRITPLLTFAAAQ